MSFPSISVVMPIRQPGPHLAGALASIRRQAVAPLEVIVVDSSGAGEAALAGQVPGLRYLSQEPRGPAAARNAGVKLARGEWIAFLDADDEWVDDALAVLAATLRADPQALFALGRTRLEPPTAEPWVSPNLGAALYRREVFERVGFLSETVADAEDVDWFLRAREQNIPYAVVDRVVLCYRRWAGGMSADRSWREIRLEPLLRASLARRRQQAGGAARELPLLSGSKDDPRASGPVNHDHSRDQTH